MPLSAEDLGRIFREAHDTGHAPLADQSRLSRVKAYLQRLLNWRPDSPFTNAVLISVVVVPSIILISSALGFYHGDWLPGVLTEAHGMLGDLLVLVLVLTYLNRVTERQRDIQRHQEVIDDYRGWKTPEAALRIAGSARRLNSLNVTAINLQKCFLQNADLRGIILRKADLSYADLRGCELVTEEVVILKTSLEVGHHDAVRAQVYYGNDLPPDFLEGLLPDTELAAQVKEYGPQFESANLSHCDFSGTNLRSAKFKAADLHLANLSDCTLDIADFSECDLLGTIFDGADLSGARFDNARGLTVEQLSRAYSLKGIKGLDAGLMQDLLRDYKSVFEWTAKTTDQ